MCVDFINLNQAYPRDCFPLPRIDQLVDAIASFDYCSLDAYFGYHQILMDLKDEDKTSLITNKGAFYYKIISFGIKNAGATYQRMVTKVFKGLLAGNMEAYMNDMLVKSLLF